MLVHDFAYIDAPAGEVRARLLDSSGAWLGHHATRAAHEGEAVRVRLGPHGHGGRVTKEIIVSVGDPLVRDVATVIPLTWKASGAPAFFPVFHGDLEVAEIGGSQTQISIWGNYEPPLGSIGESLNRFALHRIAEASVRAFLMEVAAALGAPLPA